MDEWIRLRADSCRTQSGALLDPFYVLEYLDWTHVVAFDEQQRLVLIRQYRHGIGRVIYELPGGMVDSEEKDVLESIERELKEETGYVAKELTPLGHFSPNPATHTNMVHSFLATDCTKASNQQLDEAEEIQVELVTVAEFFKILERGEFLQAFHISSVYLALDRLGLISHVR